MVLTSKVLILMFQSTRDRELQGDQLITKRKKVDAKLRLMISVPMI